eukprot:12420481-Alexandrium_andersonii.AAC.1
MARPNELRVVLLVRGAVELDVLCPGQGQVTRGGHESLRSRCRGRGGRGRGGRRCRGRGGRRCLGRGGPLVVVERLAVDAIFVARRAGVLGVSHVAAVVIMVA